MSQAATMPVPPPKQAPCTSATVGTGNWFSRCTASAVAREARKLSSGEEARTVSSHLRSAPAWKFLPAPVSSTARKGLSARSS